MSAYSIDAVIWMSIATIISTFGFTFLMTPYAHLALLIRLTFVKMIALLGVGMWVSPVKFRRPYFGVLTISARSPWFQYAGSSSFVYACASTSRPWAPGSRFGWNGSSATQPLKPGPVSFEPWKRAAL